MDIFRGFIDRVRTFQSIGLTAPEGADGDSVGTQCALKEILEATCPGIKVRIINEDTCPERYKLLPGSAYFETGADVAAQDLRTWPELMICVDGDHFRLGVHTERIWQAAKARAQVDHHRSSAKLSFDFRLYDPDASATTILVYRLVQALGMRLTPTLAQAIYTGIIFDTGMFKHSNTTPDTMRIGAELLAAGFGHTDTAEKILLIRSKSALGLLQRVLGRIRFEDQDQVVWSYLEHHDLIELGAGPADREGMIDHLFLTPSCEVAVLFFEQSPDVWKVSLRSRNCDVAELAASLAEHGGGHVRAAGCTVRGKSPEVFAQVIEKVRATVKRLPSPSHQKKEGPG